MKEARYIVEEITVVCPECDKVLSCGDFENIDQVDVAEMDDVQVCPFCGEEFLKPSPIDWL